MGLLQETQQDYYDGNDFGGYQFVSLDNIITNFTIAYVGENKIIPKIKRTDIAFHAQRAIQELSFDTFKSIKSQEITLPPSLTMTLPQDYVNYTKICWVDGNGIERPLYPTRHTSNPTPILQNADGDYKLTAVGTLTIGSNLVVLDKIYKNILVGMQVNAPNFNNVDVSAAPSFPLGTVVGSVVHDSPLYPGVTVIGLVDYLNGGFPSIINVEDIVNGTAVNSNFTGDETLTFNMFPEPFASDGGNTAINESLVIETGSGVVLNNLIYSVNNDKITTASAADAAQVSVGMYVSHSHLTPGTRVVDVNGSVITVSTRLLENFGVVNFGSTNQMTFITIPSESETWEKFQTVNDIDVDDALAYNHDTDIYDLNVGQRYGLEPEHAQTNGTYYIDELKGKIHFSSNVAQKTVILKYISDGLATDNEMIVHKFAEEAMYKSIAYAILSTSTFGQGLVPRFKREKFAAIRTAKLRLSNIKIHELVQTMRNKSAWIKR